MNRRQSIAALGAAAAMWPFRGRAQQAAPLIGFLNSASPDTYRFNADSFREGLAKVGFVEGRNLRIEERWAHGDYDALPALAAELVGIGVLAIAATGDVASARAAQRASSSVPVVFTIGGDPVRFGLVRKHKPSRRARDWHPFQPKCPRSQAGPTPPANCPKHFASCIADESEQSQCQYRRG